MMPSVFRTKAYYMDMQLKTRRQSAYETFRNNIPIAPLNDKTQIRSPMTQFQKVHR